MQSSSLGEDEASDQTTTTTTTLHPLPRPSLLLFYPAGQPRHQQATHWRARQPGYSMKKKPCGRVILRHGGVGCTKLDQKTFLAFWLVGWLREELPPQAAIYRMRSERLLRVPFFCHGASAWKLWVGLRECASECLRNNVLGEKK